MTAEYVLAVDIGGTKADAALVAVDGTVLRESVTRRPTGRDATREELVAALRDVAETARSHLPEHAVVRGVGVGSAGPVDLVAGTVSPLNLPAAADLPVAEALSGVIDGGPFALALDGTCIAVAEHRFGALRGCRNALGMIVSTGVGGGFILDGRPVTGTSGNAGHIGQIRVRTLDADDPAASSLEAIAAGPGSVAWARAQGWEGRTGEDLARAYRDGSELAARTVARSADAVGQAIATASTLLDLEAVAIAGGFANVTPDYVERVEASARAAALHPYARRVRVVRSALDGDGPLLGAAALVLPS